MDFVVLGPLAVNRDGEEVPLGGPKQRALLAILLLNANQAVSRDRLIDGIWGERPPPTAVHTLDNYISRLRKMLGNGRVSRRAHGYALEVRPGELDLDRFEQLLLRGRGRLADDDPRRAAADLRAALALWRGPALADLRYESLALAEAERLEERRLQALEDRIEADLALGGDANLVTELEVLVREHPFRERLLGALMLALYRAGRHAEALAALETGRQRLAGELGLEPGPQLRVLQRKILEHDPSLASPHRAGTRIKPRGRRRAVVAAATGISLLAGAVTAVVLGTGGTTVSEGSTTASRLVGLGLGDGDRRQVSLGDAPAAVAVGDDSLWLALPGSGAVSRVDLRQNAVVDRIPVGGTPALLAFGGGSLWVASTLGDRVMRVDPGTGAVSQTVALGAARAAALEFGAGALWIADAAGDSLLEVDPAAGELRRSLPLSVQPSALAISDGVMWVADYGGGSVAEVDLRSGHTLENVHVGRGPTALAAGTGAVWVANALDSTVSRIDPRSGSVVATIPVGSGPAALALSGGSVWVANQYAASVSRIAPDRNTVVDTAAVRGEPTSLASGAGRTWIGVRPLAQHRGGTLRLLHTRLLSIDPAINVDILPLQSDSLTRDGLLTYRRAAGPAGTELVPDLAISLPAPTDGDTTYTFRLRPGIRYSDGRPVRAGDFPRAIERALRLQSPSSAAFMGLVGAAACSAEGCDLSRGIVTDEEARTVTFHLRAPDADFLAGLALAAASAVPAGTPLTTASSEPIPGTGPYKIASASRREIRYVRNPFFREWSHAAQPDGNPDAIVMRFGLSPGEAVRAIEEGRADWSADNVPAARLRLLRSRYGSRLHTFTIPTTDFAQINTTLRPFNDVRVRKALNFALDRRKIAQLSGGPDLATPTCQILPPGLPGYRSYCPYTRRPGRRGTWHGSDLARARRLVAATATRGEKITVWSWTDDPTITPAVPHYVAAVLRRLGYRARVHLVSHASLQDAPARSFQRIQLILAAWGDTPNGLFSTFFACRGASAHGWFCDRRLQRLMRRAQLLNAAQPRAAAALWARLDRELTDRAVWAPMVNEHGLDFVSARVRNYQVHPYWGLIADQIWLR